ncbi:MAG: transglutaminase domain-containing protein, partial [Ignavibacteriae bacterium]|nr:transglutaminase domain-containing protein [Ignavibacteriota bacterium]
GHSKGNINFKDFDILLSYLSSQKSSFLTISEAYKEFKVYSNRTDDYETISKIATFCYRTLKPEKPHSYRDGKKILENNYAWCGGYARAAKYLCELQNFRTRITTFFLEGLPFGRGDKGTDTHTVLEVWLPEKKQWIICDAMAGIVFPNSVNELIENPELADKHLETINFVPDQRWIDRKYEWYSSSKAYSHAKGMKHPIELVEKIITSWENVRFRNN